jgi:hypothetical protein
MEETISNNMAISLNKSVKGLHCWVFVWFAVKTYAGPDAFS